MPPVPAALVGHCNPLPVPWCRLSAIRGEHGVEGLGVRALCSTAEMHVGTTVWDQRSRDPLTGALDLDMEQTAHPRFGLCGGPQVDL